MAGSSESHCVFLETNLDTRVAIDIHNGESIPDFKERLCEKHLKNFPEIGKISISAFKVKLRGQFYHLSDDDFLIYAKACEHIFYVDALSVEKPKTKKQKQKIERRRRQKLKRNKPLKNQDATRLNMGTVNTTCGEVQVGAPLEKEKKQDNPWNDVSVPRNEEEKNETETAVVTSDVKNQDANRLDMGTVNTTCEEVQVEVTIEKYKKRKMSPTKTVLETDQSSNRSKISRISSKDQADATESKDITSNGLEACIYNPLDVNIILNGTEAAYPTTYGVSAPTIVELNSAVLEEAPPLENANEAPKKSDSSLLKKSTEVCDFAGNTLVLVGTIGNGLVECLLDHSNKQQQEGRLETETAVVTSDVKNQDATPLDIVILGTVNTTCGEVQVDAALEKEKKQDNPWNDVSVARNEEVKHETETAVVTSDVKNQDASRLDMGTVTTTCGEVQVGVSAPTTVSALEEAPPIENTNETDALLTPAKNDIEIIEVSDDSEDDSISKQILKEKSDIVGGGKKQDQVTGRAKSSVDNSSDSSSDYVLMRNNLGGGTNMFLGSLQDILRRSNSYKKALLRAFQSHDDDWFSDAESPVTKKF